MLDPKDDNLENIREQYSKETDESKSTHFHKTISSIFGKLPSFKAKPAGIQEAVNASHVNLGGSSRGGLIFKLLPAVAPVFILLTFLFYARSQKEAGRRIRMEGELAEVSTEAKSLQASLEVMKVTNKVSEQIKSELEQLKNNEAEANRKLEGISGEKLKLENTLQEKDKKINELSNQLTELAKIKSDLEARLKGAQQASELQGENQKEITPEEIVKKSGKILAVKPTSNIVAINLGSRDGIKVGSTFDIYSLDNSFVAKLIIDEVEDTVSLGKISPGAVVAKVKESYIVKLK